MTDGKQFGGRVRRIQWALLVVFALSSFGAGSAPPAATSGFNRYAEILESRLRGQHRSAQEFLGASSPEAGQRLRRAELIIERLTPEYVAVPGALLHHWRGTAFVPGASAGDFERLMRDFTAYPQHFGPQVVRARWLAHDGDHYQVSLRVRQHHVLTVVMDTTYEIDFGRLDARHGYSTSRSTSIVEVDGAGTAHERELGTGEEHGFLWRLNSYWSYVEADEGLYMRIESVSLTREIPRGLGWIVRPFVQSIPRESLEFTLSATRDALLEAARMKTRSER